MKYDRVWLCVRAGSNEEERKKNAGKCEIEYCTGEGKPKQAGGYVVAVNCYYCLQILSEHVIMLSRGNNNVAASTGIFHLAGHRPMATYSHMPFESMEKKQARIIVTDVCVCEHETNPLR